ncbi:MAG: peptide chain release factor 2 [Chlamydiota bacterium]|nr:peptide chain release factor 2 [Chlamydiota bacterium]
MDNELEQKFLAIQKRTEDLRRFLDFSAKKDDLHALETKMAQQDFWDDQEHSKSVVKELKKLRSIIIPFEQYYKDYEEAQILFELLMESRQIEPVHEQELLDATVNLERVLADLELRNFLSGEYDQNNAIISLNAGAGGTEACDWVDMLLRMYRRWCQRHGFKDQITEILTGEEAGIKNVTLIVEGDYAYGYLKAEKGVHRLVRISPFDANKRRHTSFASLDVIPEVNDDIEIDIDESDLRIDTFRSSGAGGQHVNKTDSAIRITHNPTGIVVTCQNERSQFKNKATAMKVLKARMYNLKVKEQEEKMAKVQGQKSDIAWGSQIRSYVFHPYTMVKDLRTHVETSNTNAVMDGDIDLFIQAYLKHQ